MVSVSSSLRSFFLLSKACKQIQKFSKEFFTTSHLHDSRHDTSGDGTQQKPTGKEITCKKLGGKRGFLEILSCGRL